MRKVIFGTALGLAIAASGAAMADDTKGQAHEHSSMSSSAQSPGSKALHDSMTKGMQEMQSMSMSGDADRDFATMMIQHHEQAIDMARAQLKYGKDAQVRKKAQEIIAASEKDIADLKAWNGRRQANAE